MGEVQQGQILVGKYRVEQVLGRGGMGVVVAATHLALDERVALKFMLPEAMQSPEAATRFLREARAAVKLKSEHVARVLDVGTLETGAPYIVMEFLKGADLAALVEQRGPLPVVEAADYVLQACDAIAEAHSLGIIHRDLKPGNLFVTRRPDGAPLVKVLDFGISKASSLGDSGVAMTKSSALLGSPLYMSPEQMKSSRSVDASLVMRCLETDLSRRCGSVAELARGLAPFAPPHVRGLADRIAGVLRASVHEFGASPTMPAPAAVVTQAQDGAGAAGAPAQTGAAWGATAPGVPVKRGPKVAAVALALGACALAAGAFALRARSHPDGAAPAAQGPARADDTVKAPPSAVAAPLPPPSTAAAPPGLTPPAASDDTPVAKPPAPPRATSAAAAPPPASARPVPAKPAAQRAAAAPAAPPAAASPAPAAAKKKGVLDDWN